MERRVAAVVDPTDVPVTQLPGQADGVELAEVEDADAGRDHQRRCVPGGGHIDLPLVLVGGAGGLKGGRVLRHPKDTPMNNLLLAMLGRAGVDAERFGDATGVLPLEPLAGV